MEQALKQTSTINVRVDNELKRDVENLCDSLGMNISTAVNMFFRQIVRTKGIPFHITTVELDPTIQARRELWAAIRAIQDDSVINGTDKITMDEINDIISECRQEAGAIK
jgi:DNA-damage-inducible protein J